MKIKKTQKADSIQRFRIFMIMVFLIWCLGSIVSCHGNNKTAVEPDVKKADTGINKTYERGPATVVLSTDRKDMSIADRLHLTITVTADENYTVQLPRFGEKLEQFGIVDYQTTEPELIDKNRIKISRSYVLEPFLSGKYKIPPMTVEFWKKGAKNSDHHKVETQEITINVTSLLPEKMAGLKIHGIKPPVNLPAPYKKWLKWAIIAVGIILTGLIGFFIIKKRKSSVDVVARAVPSHELAFRELEALVDEKLIEKGEIKQFYRRISGILRKYIENRFNINAPEQTTEEFLGRVKANGLFTVKHKTLLNEFLKHCDLVKFAEHQAEDDEIQKTFDSCKHFIMETARQVDQ